MTRPRRAVFGVATVAALALAAAALVPLRLVIDRVDLPAALAATDASGTLWDGRLHHVHWNGRPIGDIDVALQPLPLLAGIRRVRVTTPEGSFALLHGRRRGIDDARGSTPVPVAGLPGEVELRVHLDDARMLFDAGGCHAAGGTVRLVLAMPGTASPHLELDGSAACDGPVARVALAAPAGAALDADATLEVAGDGGWRLHAMVRTADPTMGPALRSFGFQEGPGGFSRVEAGRIGGR